MDFNCKQPFIEVSLTDIRDAIYLAQHTVNSKVVELLDQNKITITCYGSDARLDKWNRGESSIDLLVCNKSELQNDELRELIKEFIEKSKDIVEDNSYPEIQPDGEIIQIHDEIQVGREISQLQKNDYYIDVLNFDEELYKYGNKTYPDRLIDAYNLTGNHELFWEFKKKMLSDIIEKPKILKDFRQDVKSYFKEETIRGKNLRKGSKNHFNFDLGKDFGILRYDKKDYFGFKHGPMRAIQYKIIEKFISFVIEKKDITLIKKFPFSIEKRLSYLKQNKLITRLNYIEIEELIDLYKFFREKNEEINFMYLSKKYTNNIYFLDEIDSFVFSGRDFEIIKRKLDRFVELFQKLKN